MLAGGIQAISPGVRWRPPVLAHFGAKEILDLSGGDRYDFFRLVDLLVMLCKESVNCFPDLLCRSNAC
jgi:hypothetical protein